MSQTTDNPQGIIQLSGSIIDGTTVKIDFNSLQGSNPSAQEYFVAIWQGTQIQDLKSALQTQRIKTTNRAGSLNFEKLSLAKLDYVIGFGVNLNVGTTICATLSVPAKASIGPLAPAVLSTLVVSEANIGTDSLVGNYVTPVYNQPANNKNWIALFPDVFTANCFQGSEVIASTVASSNGHVGNIALNNIPNGLVRFETYTLVYGMSYDSGEPNYSDIIAYYTFVV